MELITKEQVEASLITDVTKLNFQQLIEISKTVSITTETIKANYPALLQMRDLYLFLKDRLDEQIKPYKDQITIISDVYKGYMKQIESILSDVEPVLASVNKSLLLSERIIIDEINKQSAIRQRHIDFVKEMTHKIVVTEDSKELARVQSLIGTEKSRTGFYGEHHPHLSKSCDSLLELIESRKKIIKENNKLKREKQKYELKKDIVRVTQLDEQIKFNEQVIKENAEVLAGEAFNQFLGIAIAPVDQIESAAVQPRTHRWAYKVIDIEKLHKEMPHLVDIIPNKKAISAFMKEKIDEGGLDNIEDNVFSGLAIYWKSFFVAIKTDTDAS